MAGTPNQLFIFDQTNTRKPAGASSRKRTSRLTIDSGRWSGARVFFLTKYSPDLNPIEKHFVKLKH